VVESHWHTECDARDFQSRAYAELQRRPEILFVGSSHFRQAIDPRLFSRRVCNLNHSTLDFAFVRRLLVTSLDVESSVTTCVLEFSPVVIFMDTLEARGLGVDFSKFGLSAWDYPSDRLTQAAYWIHELPLLRTPKITPAEVIRIIRIAPEDVVPGYTATDETLIDRGTDAAKEHLRHLQTGHVLTRNIHELQSSVEFLHSCGMEVIFLTTPHLPGYFESLPDEIQQRYEQLLSDLKRDARVRVLDLRDPQSLGMLPEHFRDGDHLNASGAAVFSPIVERAIFDSSLPAPAADRQWGITR